jgi:restriction system-associated AAA family ATPase
LLSVAVVRSSVANGLLDGLQVDFRRPLDDVAGFQPTCLIGPNGAGKSQFLQVVAEAMQAVLHACVPEEERIDANPGLEFVIEYLISPRGAAAGRVHVRVSRGDERPELVIARREAGEWVDCDPRDPATRALLPTAVVAYTSGDNETLSVPFFGSRTAYAGEVASRAIDGEDAATKTVAEPRLMLIDYATHLELLVANLMCGDEERRAALLDDARLGDAHSFRCVIQLAHSAVARRRAAREPREGRPERKRVQLTDELERVIEQLQACATAHSYEDKTETYIFDYFVTEETRAAFRTFWPSARKLYSDLHKLAMLNDLAIPATTRRRFERDTAQRRFATRLPEPQDEQKVFRFERVQFTRPDGAAGPPVDYVSLSDGEHQLGQLLGTMAMLSDPGILFLLDEPESHFNPQWRVAYVSKIRDVPTDAGTRGTLGSASSDQECLLTTHAPFVPSDLPREQVIIFGKDAEDAVWTRRPNIETFGAPGIRRHDQDPGGHRAAGTIGGEGAVDGSPAPAGAPFRVDAGRLPTGRDGRQLAPRLLGEARARRPRARKGRDASAGMAERPAVRLSRRARSADRSARPVRGV